MSGRRRVAILISGRGSNMQALLHAAAAADFPAGIELVCANQPNAAGLQVAASRGVRTQALDHRAFGGRLEFERELDRRLNEAGIELVCLAGFMRLLTPWFVDTWRDRLINIHPSLLPAFPGLHTHQRALAAGVKLHGATVHFVRAETDHGPIIAQGAVPVQPGDTPEILAARVLAVEHRLYPLALRLVAGGAVHVSGDSVVGSAPVGDGSAALLSPSDAPAPAA